MKTGDSCKVAYKPYPFRQSRMFFFVLIHPMLYKLQNQEKIPEEMLCPQQRRQLQGDSAQAILLLPVGNLYR